ncbi:aminotransferase class I/II-fold pyridoxal phosphate-dependent enzyme [uncultured Clostridium sp.]|uniref:aminotransferase class I/II-fold pyridoxal phosphate-dependent enzyme n=1 Tax=uncultured Clostridium sp. TaxID=59620 RepID=UPI0034A0BF9F
MLSSDLCYDASNYYIDFDNLERKLSDKRTTLMILYNPHNPIGKVWDRETLERLPNLKVDNFI